LATQQNASARDEAKRKESYLTFKREGAFNTGQAKQESESARECSERGKVGAIGPTTLKSSE